MELSAVTAPRPATNYGALVALLENWAAALNYADIPHDAPEHRPSICQRCAAYDASRIATYQLAQASVALPVLVRALSHARGHADEANFRLTELEKRLGETYDATICVRRTLDEADAALDYLASLPGVKEGLEMHYETEDNEWMNGPLGE